MSPIVVHWSLATFFHISVGMLFLVAVCTVLGLVFYGILRLIPISEDWTTRVVGATIGISAMAIAVVAFVPSGASRQFIRGWNALPGAVSFGVAVFATHEWTARHAFKRIKAFPVGFVVRLVRGLLLFARRHHQLLGWLVLLTATVHGVMYLPHVSAFPTGKLLTGVIAWLVLIVLTVFGLRIADVKGAPRLLRSRQLHTIATAVFFVALIVHFSALVL